MKKHFFILALTIIFINPAKSQINVTSNGVMIGSTSATPIKPLHVLGDAYIPLGSSYWIGSTVDI